jgi:hypothetical protein
MNALEDLRTLTDLFPHDEPLFQQVEHIPSAVTPEPYKSLLVHAEHMTVSMERFHDSPVAVGVLGRRQQGDEYAREIVLTKQGTTIPVQYGLVRFHLEYVTEPVRREILAERTPLGRILINHNVLRHIDLAAILEITAGPGLAAALHMPVGAVTYGRLATIFCDRQPAVDLLEISAPLTFA